MNSLLARIERLEEQREKLPPRPYILDEADTPDVEAEAKRIRAEHPEANILIITNEKDIEPCKI